ncbi:MAG: GNAT family N-acetyltransferase [Alphaproteobacteria bacterium]|nr:GNAT family N-acetyltransferase [Alphaproteobacteria bacterium]
MNSGLTCRVVASDRAWIEAEEGWARIAARGARVGLFQDHAWLGAWWRAAAGAPAAPGLHTVIVSDEAGPVAIAPLVVRRDRFPARLIWMALEVSDYCDLIALPGLDAGRLWRALKPAMAASGAAIADLSQLPPDGAAAGLLRHGARAGTLALKSPYLDLAGRTWPEVEKSFSGSFRQEMRRKGRRLAKQLPWRCAEYADPARRAAAVEFVVAQKRRQFADEPAACAQLEQVFAPFARDVFMRDRIGQARVHVSALEAEADGRMIAAHLGFVDADRFYYYVPAFDPEFQADSPGQLLIYELVRRAAEERVPVFDMLRGDYAYKWRLTDAAVTLMSILEPLGILGGAYLGARAIARRVRPHRT